LATLVAYVGAAAFVFVTVANPPRFDPGMPLDAHLHRWLNWFVTTLPQQRLDTGVAIAGFLCLVPLAGFARDLLGRDRVLARMGSLALPTGALLWVTGNLRAVPRAWCGYSLLLGVVLLGLSGAYAANDNLVGLLLGKRCPTDTSHLLAGGALLLPVWLLWTGRLLRTDDRTRHASRGGGSPRGKPKEEPRRKRR
jgi:hypothetical protein